MTRETFRSGTEFIGSGPEFDLLLQLAVVQAKQGELQEKQIELLDKLMGILTQGRGQERGVING